MHSGDCELYRKMNSLSRAFGSNLEGKFSAALWSRGKFLASPLLGWCRWTDGHHMIFSKKAILLPRIAMACAVRIRRKPTEINELESVGTPRVSGHQNPTSSDGATASGSRRLSGKSRKITEIHGILDAVRCRYQYN